MSYLQGFLRWLNTPFRVLFNMTSTQMRSVFAMFMLTGIVVLSSINVWYTYRAEGTIVKGHEYHSFFALIQEQVRINSGLIAWFAVIMGLIVFGADYFRARWGDKEIGLGKGPEPTVPTEPPAPLGPIV